MLLRVINCALILSLVAAFSNYLVRKHCDDRQFEVGEIIMGEAVKRSVDFRITVYAADEQIKNGSSIPHLKSVKVALGKVYKFAFEARCLKCYFENGSCAGLRRTTEGNATLVIPNPEVVELRALWGRVYGKVFLTESFILNTRPFEDL